MSFKIKAMGYFVTYENGVTEEVNRADFFKMLKRQVR